MPLELLATFYILSSSCHPLSLAPWSLNLVILTEMLIKVEDTEVHDMLLQEIRSDKKLCSSLIQVQGCC